MISHKLWSAFHYLTSPYRIKRTVRFWWQRRSRGWSDDETWNLDSTFSAFIAPRLRRYAEIMNGHPTDMTYNEWKSKVTGMAEAFDWLATNDDRFFLEAPEEVVQGLEDFVKYYRHLWW